MKDNTFGNTLASHEKVAYIVGDEFAALSKLSRVLTIKQFTIAALERQLPPHRVWIVGQGISDAGLQFLHLCENHLSGVRFYFGSQVRDVTIATHSKASIKNFEWRNFQFVDATRVQAELQLAELSAPALFTQDFIFTAARELCEHACQSALPGGVLVIKQASLQNFHRLFPLSISVETQFHLAQDNKRSLKSLTRFYQDFSCTTEVTLSFDLYSHEQAETFYHELAEKTFEHLSAKMEESI